MPELPEVETVRRGLQPVLEGAVIAAAVARRGDLRWKLPDDFARRLTGRRVLKLRRRAKYILADLDQGETLIMHLGMSGRFTIYPPGSNSGAMLGRFHHAAPEAAAGAGPHDHVLIETGAGARIVYNDHRRFGMMDLTPTATLEQHRLFRVLGPEPLDPPVSASALAAALRGKSAPIKAALLDQRVIAGLGNIYVCEALFDAGIHPKRKAGSLRAERVARLARAVTATLNAALAAGGSTLRDYRNAEGGLGYFQHRFKVYDRAGEPCSRKACGGIVRRIVQSGRSSFYCPVCQR